jgi:hypothetical protein
MDMVIYPGDPLTPGTGQLRMQKDWTVAGSQSFKNSGIAAKLS